MARPFRIGLGLFLFAVAATGFTADPNGTPAAPNKLDLKFVPDNAFALSMIEPHRLLTGPQGSVYAFLLQSIGGKNQLGFDPNDIDQAMAIIGTPDAPDGPPHAGFVVRYTNSFDQAALAAKIAPKGDDKSLGGCKARISGNPYKMSCAFPDEKTVLIATSPDLDWLLTANTNESPLRKLAAASDDSPQWQLLIAVTPIRPVIAPALAQAPQQLPPQFSALPKIPMLADTFTASLRETPNNAMQFDAVAVSPNEASAKELATDVKQVLAAGRDMLISQLGQVPPQVVSQVQTMSEKVVQGLQPTQEGNRVNFHADIQSGPAAVGMTVALILPAVQAAHEAAQRNSDSNNLKQLGLAILNYEDQQKRFPAQAICDKQGKPLLSWRVAVLPQLEEDELYKQFHLDEPWDSEHNKALIEKMPESFVHPKFKEPGKTVYQVVYGKGFAFDGTEGKMLKDFPRGLSKTILIVETTAENAVPWTKPEDWTPDDNDSTKGIGIWFAGDIANFAFVDCHVEGILLKQLDPKIFKTFLMR